MPVKTIWLKKGKEASLQRYHRWVFSGAIHHADAGIAEGDLVEVKSKEGNFLGLGYFSNGSISVKILDFRPAEINPGWFETKIKEAVSLRESAGLWNNPDTNCFRLIHAEGDGIPGLIADYYDGHIVLQVHSLGIYRFREMIAGAFRAIIPDVKTIFLKLPDKSAGFNAGQTREWLFGDSTSAEVKENGIRFTADWEKGQKTGFFLDQRENRKLLGRYGAGKKVLNTFCYTGGFSLYALQNGAASVDSVDYSQWAIAQAKENISLNSFTPPHEEICGDALKYLSDMGQDYDLIVLDPPAFAKSVSSRHNAIQAYKRINQMAIKKIRPGGILFTFSCSQVVDEHMFSKAILSAAIEVGREVKILHSLSQPADHPVSIFHTESGYLKGLVLYIQ